MVVVGGVPFGKAKALRPMSRECSFLALANRAGSMDDVTVGNIYFDCLLATGEFQDSDFFRR